MVETSNNIIAALLVVAIIISGMSVITLMGTEKGPLEGYATGTGTANVTVSGEVAIAMLRNVTNFGTDSLGGAARYISTDADNAVFDDGGEGNGSTGSDVYGTCDNTEPKCAFPFVVRNMGNQNITIGVNMSAEASSWISAGAGMYLKAQSNETEACNEFAGEYGKDTTWIPVNVSAATNNACTSLGFDDNEGDELRIHFRLLIPSDTPPSSYGQLVTVTAVAA